MAEQKIIDGNHAAAEAMRQINPDVVGAYPITPTSYIFEVFSQHVADGKVQTELVTAESEHAAMSVCIGAAAGGGRAMSATASQGLALMHETLFNASGMRLPIVLFTGNRSLGAPLSIHGDHSDAMAERDTGWIQIFPDSPQEVYDFSLQSVRISEDERVRTPVMLCMDAFHTTHLLTQVSIETDESTKAFIGTCKQIHPLLDVENPVAYGGWDMPNMYTEHRRGQLQGLIEATLVISEIGTEFGKTFGRDYSEHTESYRLEDAEVAIILMGSLSGAAKIAVETLREQGIKAGLLRVRTFRPFPAKEIVEKLQQIKQIAVFDRTSPAGAALPPLAQEIQSALYTAKNRPTLQSFVTSLGGRETSPADIVDAVSALVEGGISKEPKWINLRENA